MTNSTSNEIRVSPLQLYFGDPFIINDKIQIFQPTIGDILEYDKQYGESEFWGMLNVFIGNTTSYRLLLWDMGVDWNEISDFQLFSLLIKTINHEQSKIITGDIDFSTFDMYTKQLPPKEGEEETESKTEMILYNPELDIEINEDTYETIALYIRTMFNMFPKREFAKGKTTKEWIIEEERMNLVNRKDDGNGTSALLPLIESCCCHPGFKYKKNELREVGIYEFMRDVQRLQVYESTTALLKGMYSGFIDVKGIDKSEFDFMREIDNGKNKRKKK